MDSMNNKIYMVPYDPQWDIAFEAEATNISDALGSVLIAIHHVGSTAIPRICAKPIIDILVEADEIGHLDELTSAMEALGYEAMGEYGIPERRYFRKSDSAGVRTHHVHAYTAGSYGVQRLLAFRDYLITHPAEADEYSALKLKLTQLYPEDRTVYQEGKDAFLKRQKQKLWRGNCIRHKVASTCNGLPSAAVDEAGPLTSRPSRQN